MLTRTPVLDWPLVMEVKSGLSLEGKGHVVTACDRVHGASAQGVQL